MKSCQVWDDVTLNYDSEAKKRQSYRIAHSRIRFDASLIHHVKRRSPCWRKLLFHQRHLWQGAFLKLNPLLNNKVTNGSKNDLQVICQHLLCFFEVCVVNGLFLSSSFQQDEWLRCRNPKCRNGKRCNCLCRNFIEKVENIKPKRRYAMKNSVSDNFQNSFELFAMRQVLSVLSRPSIPNWWYKDFHGSTVVLFSHSAQF